MTVPDPIAQGPREEDAFAYANRATREEGIFIGPSSGASLAAAERVMKPGKMPPVELGAWFRADRSPTLMLPRLK